MVALFLGRSVWLACLSTICWSSSLSPLELLRQHSHLGLSPRVGSLKALPMWCTMYLGVAPDICELLCISVSTLICCFSGILHHQQVQDFRPTVSKSSGFRIQPWLQDWSQKISEKIHAPVPCSSWTHHLLLLQHDLELSDSPYQANSCLVKNSVLPHDVI